LLLLLGSVHQVRKPCLYNQHHYQYHQELSLELNGTKLSPSNTSVMR